MPSLIRPIRMIHTLSAHHHLDAGKLLTTIFASVFGLFGAFVQLVAPFVAAVRMICAGAGGQCTYIGKLLPAILTVIILSFHGY